jgi:hypothetical protein
LATKSPDLTACPQAQGYWKHHGTQTTALLPLQLGNDSVDTFAKAQAVLNGKKCGASTPQSAIGCLAARLLATKLNRARGSDPCIDSVVAHADELLIGKSYTGPTRTYTLTAAERALVIDLMKSLDTDNNGGGGERRSMR